MRLKIRIELNLCFFLPAVESLMLSPVKIWEGQTSNRRADADLPRFSAAEIPFSHLSGN